MTEAISQQYQQQLDGLAAELVTPKRFQQPVKLGWGGEVAVTQVAQLYEDTPETRLVFGRFPEEIPDDIA